MKGYIVEAERLREIIAATITGFDASLRHEMPATPYREFQLWAMRSPLKDTWWQVLGIPHTAKLTTRLIGDAVDDERDRERLLEYATTMNRYLLYEAATDNFANFLQTQALTHPLRPFQVHTISRLNDAIIARLEGDTTPTVELLGSAKPAVGKLSCFANSSVRAEQSIFAQRFAEERRDISLNAVEFGGWALLVANVETCMQVAGALDGCRLSALLRDGLSWKYQAVNHLLYSLDMPLPELIEMGAYSSLVIPHLAYYISVLNEQIAPNPHLNAILENNLLEKALYKAALLVRLTTDVGTTLLTSDEYHAMLIDRLSLCPQHTINDALVALSADAPLLTRFRDHIAFGKYNVCLYNVGTSRNNDYTRERLAHNLGYLAREYRQQRAQLVTELSEITALMESSLTSRLIWRCVEFHERMYTYPFTAPTDEYALPNA